MLRTAPLPRLYFAGGFVATLAQTLMTLVLPRRTLAV
jgi:hypothetical protein